MNKWLLGKKISKFIAAIFIILCLLQVYSIMNGYYQRNKDKPNFWSLKEEYSYQSYKNEIPPELKERQKELNNFQTSCILLFLSCIFVEFFRYKEDPEKWKHKIENDKYLNWFKNKVAPKFNKIVKDDKEDKEDDRNIIL